MAAALVPVVLVLVTLLVICLRSRLCFLLIRLVMIRHPSHSSWERLLVVDHHPLMARGAHHPLLMMGGLRGRPPRRRRHP